MPLVMPDELRYCPARSIALTSSSSVAAGSTGCAAVFGQHPGQLSVLHLDQSAGRGRRGGGHAGELERLAVADRDMAAGTHQMHWIVRRDAIELLAPRMALHVELELVIAARQHPFARAERLGARLDEGEQIVERRRRVGRTSTSSMPRP